MTQVSREASLGAGYARPFTAVTRVRIPLGTSMHAVIAFFERDVKPFAAIQGSERRPKRWALPKCSSAL